MLYLIKAHKYQCIDGQVIKLDKIQMGHDAEKTLMKEFNAKKAPTGSMLDLVSDSHGIKVTVYHSSTDSKWRKIIMNKKSADKATSACKKQGLKQMEVIVVAQEDGTFACYTHNTFESIHWSKMTPYKPGKVSVPKPGKPKIVPKPKKIVNVEKPPTYVAPKVKQTAWTDAETLEEVEGRFKDMGFPNIVDTKFKSSKEKLEAFNRIGADFHGVLEGHPEVRAVLRRNPIGEFGIEKSTRIADPSTGNKYQAYYRPAHPLSGVGPGAEIKQAFDPWYGEFGELLPTRHELHLNKMQAGVTGMGDTAGLLRHEVGHHIRQMALDGSRAEAALIREWETIYSSFGDEEIWQKIGKYATTNSSEGFAEAFTAYTSPLYQTAEHKLPKVMEEFFDEIIGGK